MGRGDEQFLGERDHHHFPPHRAGDEVAGDVWVLRGAEPAGAGDGVPVDAGDEAADAGADGLCVCRADETAYDVSVEGDVALGGEEVVIVEEGGAGTTIIPL